MTITNKQYLQQDAVIPAYGARVMIGLMLKGIRAC